MSHDLREVLAFYSRHPISGQQILARLESSRGSLESLRPEDLYAYDQDHYGGTRVVDILAAKAAIGQGSLVADFCAGLGGPARYIAQRYSASVICIEINPDRAQGAVDLTRRVGLAGAVSVVRGDVMRAPVASASVDAVISQEAMLHVPDKAAAIREAFRILKPGGRLAFTDWVLHKDWSDRDADLMWRGMAVQALQSGQSYIRMLGKAGFRNIEVQDLTGEWAQILQDRLAMYRDLRAETARLGAPSGNEAFYESYERLVALVRERVLGGGRFIARK
jgi:sarcosine/dimethylglycine N-methyltransferase